MCSSNTTTCFHCGHDFADRDMMPLPAEGELCPDCWETVRDAAPDMLAALRTIANDCGLILSGDDMSGMTDAELFGAIRETVQTAIQKATAEG